MKVFAVLAVANCIGFLITFIQLLIAKPTSKKVLIPIIVFSATAFALIIALDFYIEVHLSDRESHPLEIICKKSKKHGKVCKEKPNSRFKFALFVIYGE